MKAFRYRCHSCGEMHEGIPSFVFDTPREYDGLPVEQRAERALIDSDACVIDGQWFFIRVQLEIPIHGFEEPFVWGVWVSISEASFRLFADTFEKAERDQEQPFFAWFTSVPFPYPRDPQQSLKSMVHLRPYPERPFLELEPTDHPLAVDQRQGITPERAQEIAESVLHG